MILSRKVSMRRWTNKLSFKDGQFGIHFTVCESHVVVLEVPADMVVP